MTRTKAALMLDPNRRAEQLAYLSGRAEVLKEAGDHLWVSITDAQAERFEEHGIIVQLHEEADLIELPAVTFDPAASVPEPPEALRAAPPGYGASGYYLVQFIAPAEPAWVHEIIHLGGARVQDLPVNVGVFQLTTTRAEEVAQLVFVSWVGPYHPAYAISFTLAGRQEPFDAASLSGLAVDPSRVPAREEGNVRVRLFDDVPPESARARVESVATVVIEDEGGFVLSADPGAVTDLARIPGVLAVGTYLPPKLLNSRGGTIMATNEVRDFGNASFLVNLDGSGEIVGVMDNGLGTGTLSSGPVHPDFGSRVLEINNIATPGSPAPDNAASNGPHGTHTTGSIAGDGKASGGRVRGIAPACHVVFNGPQTASTLLGLRKGHDAGARVLSNSWGSSNPCAVGNSLMPTNNQYVIGNTDVVDRFCFTHPETLVLFASGNTESDIQPGTGNGVPDMNFLTEEATAKNVLTVGAVENVRSNDGDSRSYRVAFAPPNSGVGCPPVPRWPHNDWNALAGAAAGGSPQSDNPDQLALFSCRGRVRGSGGRVKPDLVAPGTNIMSTRTSLKFPSLPGFVLPKTEDPSLYMLLSGTSMATPLVAGAAVLARQYYRARFGQMRRPQLLERLDALVDPPAMAPHRDGRVAAWVRRDASGKNHIVAARFDRDWVQQGDVKVLKPDVGGHPAPALAGHGDNTLLLHRGGDGTDLQLSLFDGALEPVNAFGSGGTVTLAPSSSAEDSRRPGLCVRGDEVAVSWNESGGDRLLFRRYRAGDGSPIDGAAQSLGEMSHTSSSPFITHDGTRYAVAWVRAEGTDRRLRMRLVGGSGTPEGAQPVTLATQAQEIRDPHLIWDGRRNRFVVVWAGSGANPDEEILILFVDPTGRAGAPVTATTVPAGNKMRRPRISPHPQAGYVLLWEDDTQKYRDQANVWHNRYDVYLSFLSDAGEPDRLPPDPTDPISTAPVARSARRLLRISDTPEDTAGHAVLVDADGVAVAWQSSDEINSDLLGVYGLSVTPLGSFRAQADPRTPMIDSGKYRNHVLLEHDLVDLGGVSMTWAGGVYYLLRRAPGDALEDLQVVRTNADGLPDDTYDPSGARPLAPGWFLKHHEMYWAENPDQANHLICVSSGDSAGPDVFLLDAAGKGVEGFGTGGWLSLGEGAATSAAVSPQLGHAAAKPESRIVVVYGVGAPQADIRYAVLNQKGGFYVSPQKLASADGTARHGWFHFVNSEGPPPRSIAAWHREDGGKSAVFANRYSIRGAKQHAADIRLTDKLAGDSKNAVIAPRPVAVNSDRREYGAAWQYRAGSTQPWEIRFSRLDRDGKPMDKTPGAAPPAPGGTRDVRVIYPKPALWPPPGWPATDAIEPQLVSTYAHQPWTNALDWSPGYGLAWLAQYAPGGDRTLFFSVLDENGALAQLPLSPPYATPPPHTKAASVVQVSTSGADVRDFKLIWNGRTFRLTWTETKEGRLRHVQTSLTRHGERQVFDLPSSALLRATLINGATNIDKTPLPNIPTPPITSTNRNHGYGWGRVNLRQSLSPSPKATFHMRDDEAVGSKGSAQYRFSLPPDTKLLRVTLAWTDPPRGAGITNALHLRVVPPGGVAKEEYQGNTWQTGKDEHLSRKVAWATPFAKAVHNVEQVVIQGPPGGVYEVEVVAEQFPDNNFNQLRSQPFALVFVGSGEEMRFPGVPPSGSIPFY